MRLPTCVMLLLALAACAWGCAGETEREEMGVSPGTTSLVKLLDSKHLFEGYLVGTHARVPQRWLAVGRLLGQPGAAKVIVDSWNGMSSTGRLYAIVILERRSSDLAQRYWSELLSNTGKIEYITADVITDMTVGALARRLHDDVTNPAMMAGLERMWSEAANPSALRDER